MREEKKETQVFPFLCLVEEMLKEREQSKW
ncbi:hypothetical protein F383_04995 [Gossypium arboreum]|uniref:Uncharacterized protein n=1 Tax=Gossypium arboreum TaxID=29729 RepID=A0A0B0P7G5_GOSAR|nr:hypothetical protein F383_04995 [Gossypium arboreum]